MIALRCHANISQRYYCFISRAGGTQVSVTTRGVRYKQLILLNSTRYHRFVKMHTIAENNRMHTTFRGYFNYLLVFFCAENRRQVFGHFEKRKTEGGFSSTGESRAERNAQGARVAA